MTAPYSNTRAVLACILGVLSLSCVPGILTGLPAVLLGAFELKAVRKGVAPPQNKILAYIGIVLGGIACVLGIALAIYLGAEIYREVGNFFEGLMHSKWF